MFVDKFKLNLNSAECESTNYVQNGYFYLLEYEATSAKAMKEGFDNMPLVYCIGPDLSSINAFWGINLHYFDKGAQLYIIGGMQKKYQMFSEDKRVLLGGAQLNDIYSNIGIGLRCYNRKNIMDCSRIKMQFVPKYLGLEGKFRITDQREVNATFDLAPGNKGF